MPQPAAQAQARTPTVDRFISFDNPDDVTDKLISYGKALELCQSGLKPANPGPDGLTQSPFGGTGPSGGSATVDPLIRACCGNSDWFSADIFYDLAYDDCVDLQVFFFYDTVTRRLAPPAAEGMPISFRLDTLWDQSPAATNTTFDVVAMDTGVFSIRDASGFELGTLPATDGHWYQAMLKLYMPSAAAMPATVQLRVADLGIDGQSGGADVIVATQISGDELANAMCVMPFAQVREWAGAKRIDNVLLQSTVVRISFESGDLGQRFDKND